MYGRGFLPGPDQLAHVFRGDDVDRALKIRGDAVLIDQVLQMLQRGGAGKLTARCVNRRLNTPGRTRRLGGCDPVRWFDDVMIDEESHVHDAFHRDAFFCRVGASATALGQSHGSRSPPVARTTPAMDPKMKICLS